VFGHYIRHPSGSRYFKKSFQFGIFGPGAHQICGCAAAQQQIHRTEDDGFAGPGFTAENGQSSGKTDLQIVNDGKIPNRKLF
jgi:hypothetical protein